MRTRSAVCCFLLAASLWASASTKRETAGDYEKLVERVKNGDKTVDFRELRLAYATSAYVAPPELGPARG